MTQEVAAAVAARRASDPPLGIYVFLYPDRTPFQIMGYQMVIYVRSHYTEKPFRVRLWLDNLSVYYTRKVMEAFDYSWSTRRKNDQN